MLAPPEQGTGRTGASYRVVTPFWRGLLDQMPPHKPEAAPQSLKPLPKPPRGEALADRSEEHTSELQSLMRNSYAVFCLKKQKAKRNSLLSGGCLPNAHRERQSRCQSRDKNSTSQVA